MRARIFRSRFSSTAWRLFLVELAAGQRLAFNAFKWDESKTTRRGWPSADARSANISRST
jgi:hypothetical protein